MLAAMLVMRSPQAEFMTFRMASQFPSHNAFDDTLRHRSPEYHSLLVKRKRRQDDVEG